MSVRGSKTPETSEKSEKLPLTEPTSHPGWGGGSRGWGPVGGFDPARGGVPYERRGWHSDKSSYPVDADNYEPQMAGVDPTTDPSQYPNVPLGWVYTPLMGTKCAGMSFFHLAGPSRSLVQFAPHYVFNFTGGVFFPEPMQFDSVVCKDVDKNMGAGQWTVKIAGKDGGTETSAWIQIVGTVLDGQPLRIDWYEIFNNRSRTSIVIVPGDERYALNEEWGMGARGFSAGTALVANRTMQELQLESFVFSSRDQRTRPERVEVARLLWRKFTEDVQIRTMYTVKHMEAIHNTARRSLQGRGLEEVYNNWTGALNTDTQRLPNTLLTVALCSAVDINDVPH